MKKNMSKKTLIYTISIFVYVVVSLLLIILTTVPVFENSVHFISGAMSGYIAIKAASWVCHKLH